MAEDIVPRLIKMAGHTAGHGDGVAEAIDAARHEIERLRRSVAEMQGHTFFCQDPDGALRRWYPPAES